MEKIDISYNTQIEELIIPEYGRYVQDLIYHCKTLSDDVYRQSFAEEIINLMQIITPYNRTIEENRKKLWHHFFRIAQYDIKVSPPAGMEISPDHDKLTPEKVLYPRINDRYRHYGNYINDLIKKAVTMEPGPKRDAFSQIIGSYMKLAFKNWNKEHYVSDELIKNDLVNISKGVLSLHEDVQFNTLNETPYKSQKRVFKSNQKNNNYKNKNNKHRNFKKKI